MLSDPLPASIKDLAQIVGSITADATRAEKRSVILQEQVEDLHARWEEAGAVIDEAYSRPGSAFSRPGSAIESDGNISASFSRPGTREREVLSRESSDGNDDPCLLYTSDAADE